MITSAAPVIRGFSAMLRPASRQPFRGVDPGREGNAELARRRPLHGLVVLGPRMGLAERQSRSRRSVRLISQPQLLVLRLVAPLETERRELGTPRRAAE